MSSSKENLLIKTYSEFLDLMFYPNDPIELIDNYATRDVMGFGTTLDEKIMDLKGLKDLAILQRDQVPDAPADIPGYRPEAFHPGCRGSRKKIPGLQKAR